MARDQLLVRLMGDVRHHVEEEEAELFPQLRASISKAELREMGAKLAAARRMAPTHRHPNAPNTPPGNLVGGVAAAVTGQSEKLGLRSGQRFPYPCHRVGPPHRAD